MIILITIATGALATLIASHEMRKRQRHAVPPSAYKLDQAKGPEKEANPVALPKHGELSEEERHQQELELVAKFSGIDMVKNRKAFVEKYGEISAEEWDYLQRSQWIAKIAPEEWKLKPQEIEWSNWPMAVAIFRESVAKNKRVRFYGKVVTEDGKPLAGVTITGITGYVSYCEPSFEKIIKEKIRNAHAQKKPFFLVSDANGEFQVIEDIGQTISLQTLKKEGYVEIPGTRSVYDFFPEAAERDKFKGDKQNPAVFKMRKQ